ncbi:MAG: hypothetical protein IJD43_13800 [Thermoguttaceae bacterium]|nr:hypothetical protein [Thermoguttaceae bacterium]
MPGVIRDPFCPVRLGRQRRSDRRRSNGADLQDFSGAGTLILGSGGTLYDLSGGCADTDPAVFANLDASGQRLTLVNSENTSFTGSITASEIEKTGQGTLLLNTGDAGAVSVSALAVSAGRLNIQGGMTGDLTVENAVFSPGDPVGKTEIGGVFALRSDGVLRLEISGTEPMMNDMLIVGDTLDFDDGQIFLEFAADSLLNPSDQFSVVLSGKNSDTLKETIVGRFADSGIFENLEYVQLTTGDYAGRYAVTGMLARPADSLPEPVAWVLLILGSFGMFCCRKKK